MMFDLRLSESEMRLMASALDERVRQLFEELVHTDDRALKRELAQKHADFERLAGRVHQLIDSPPLPASA
ncbi:hypothetical protein LZC95_17565 [Pendulispora brunnea]|uniref:Uncharacterized protein n=1 Tax=Pendulispora brunnea TaxID=2905690 RepID=A0ABZ2KIZ3_9BACT